VHLSRQFSPRFLTAVLGVCLLAPAPVSYAQTPTAARPTSSNSATGSKATGSSAKKPPTTKKKRRYSARSSRARRAALARARAAARARELREAQTPKFRTDENGVLVPDIRAAAAIVVNPETGQVLFETNAQDKRSIASITKVMTALVFLEDDPDLSQQVAMERGDVRGASTTYLRAGEKLSAGDLLNLTLIASDNAAARALARISHGGSATFIDRMNEKSIELGLESTAFSDPSGLDADNVSSAYDLSRLIAYAAGDERISSIMRRADYQLSTSRRTLTIHNTNRLLSAGELDVRGGKTGFISKAGYCLATLLRLPQGDQVAVVVLGARSNALRFAETKHLFNWLSEKAQALLSEKQPE
jgi:D-alanyl-D-alanine endopeptidase (penicillin-binding protein 7)